MNYRFLKTYESLTTDIKKLKKECKSILKDNPDMVYRDFEVLLRNWRDKVIDRLNRNIDPTPEFLTEMFSLQSVSELEMFSYSSNRDHLKQDALDRRIKAAELLEHYLLLMHKVVVKDETMEVDSIQGKLDYVMDLLYEVFNDNYYSINTILDISFINYRKDEPAELGKDLCKKGYVTNPGYGRENYVKLSVKGASYVERKRRAAAKTKTQQKKDQINKKVDIVLQKLESIGYGQEIIFEEIEELKSLSGKLNKKNWVQLLKGKVVDLAVSQVINKETASYILETLSEGASKLLLEK